MDYLNALDIVIARFDEDGKPVFAPAGTPATNYVEGAVEAAYFWGIDTPPSLPHEIGGPVSKIDFPAPGGVRAGFVCFPPHSSGKLDMTLDESMDDVELGSIPGMHRSESVDFEVIVKGKVDIVLETGERRTLEPGSCLIMGGPLHAWENSYDEPCIYLAVVIGAHPLKG